MRKSLTCFVLLLAGCNYAPKYVRPEAPVPEAFPADEAQAAEDQRAQEGPATQGPLTHWQSTFTDAELQRIIETALANNRSLRATALAIEQARQQLRLATSALAPDINLQGQYSFTSVPASVSPFGQSYEVKQYSVGPTISWELDLFGRLRNQRNSAEEMALAAAEDWRAARLALIASVAELALTERVLAQQEALALDALKTRQEAADLIRTRVDAGLSSELELHQAEALVASAEVALSQRTRSRRQTHNALVELSGAAVDSLDAETVDEAVALSLPVGLPSDLLAQRPDIRAAERRLVASHADIGAAKAAMFPSISLTGGANLASSSLTGLFDKDTLAWNYVAPSINVPIFRFGELRAQVEASKVAREAAVARYEGAIQAAFREVADVLVAWPTIQTQLEAQRRALEAQQARVRLANQQWEAGAEGYLQVLDAERERFTAELSMLDVQLLQVMLRVDLFRVVGGGLESTAPLPKRASDEGDDSDSDTAG